MFAKLKFERGALTWWKSHTNTLRLESDLLITNGSISKSSFSPYFALLGMQRTNGFIGITSGEGKGGV